MKPTLYSPAKPIIIDLTVVPNADKPKWSKGKFLSGMRTNNLLELPLVTTMTWQHPYQETSTFSGSNILKCLVSTYESKPIHHWGRGLMCCPVLDDDSINAHFGIKALRWLKDNWLKLPPSQKDCLIGKTIYGLADIMFDDVNGMSMPYVTFTTEEPTFGWYSLSHNLGHNDRFLVNPRAKMLSGRPVAEFIS